MLAACLLLPFGAQAQTAGQDFMSVKRMSMELARDIAQAAVKACRDKGYQVTAAVVDRNGDTQVVMRDVYAPEVSLRIAKQKAYTSVMFSVSTKELEASRPEAGSTLNHVEGLLFARGALPIEMGSGTMVGAVGVSGAPGGDIDEACAQKGLDAVAERLQFGGM
ncbi:GlcG/HbpS family heme-binding protein [Thiohalorhabdus sp. Cl-TMA]|uniref:Heme-binding protein n=1 Tax=Thiohalorhabdus methylotrophus TaxID=3242694 RepID=A0ABV4TUI1_9GAMM